MKNKIGTILFGSLLCAILVAVVILIAIQTGSNRKMSGYIDRQDELAAESLTESGDYIEDGYKVSEQYEIISTKHISDAYIAAGGLSAGVIESGDAAKEAGEKAGVELTEQDEETLTMASEILADIVTEDMSLYEQEKAVYDWMYENKLVENEIADGTGYTNDYNPQ